MRKKMEWSWEQLDANCRRVKVIGGWLVHCFREAYVAKKTDVAYTSESLTFVLDRDHEWHIVAPIQVEETKPTVKSMDFDPRN